MQLGYARQYNIDILLYPIMVASTRATIVKPKRCPREIECVVHKKVTHLKR